MAGIFVCYRRDDSAGWARGLYDTLALHFGDPLVFMDVDNIPYGRDYVDVIEETLDATTVVLVIIGRRWLEPGTDGHPRIIDPDDPVRLEITGSLARKGLHVLPILVDDAAMPAIGHLPDDIKPLTRINAPALRHTSWRSDVSRLIAYLELLLGTETRPASPALAQTPPPAPTEARASAPMESPALPH